MQIKKATNNCHDIIIRMKLGQEVGFLLSADQHWDNPDSDRDMFLRHLKEAKEKGRKVFIFGDFFCAMQGKYDKRADKSKVRPEHNNSKYLDSLVNTAAEWLMPYREQIAVIGYGNHECYHPDTEVLTYDGWKNIKEVTLLDRVASFDENFIYYHCPNELVTKDVDGLILIEGTTSSQLVSKKHAVVLNDMSKVNAEDIGAICDLDMPHGRKMYSGLCPDGDDPKFLEFISAVICDATLVAYPKNNKRRVQFKLSKQRKIDYIKQLCDDLGIKYTFRKSTMSPTNKIQPYYITIYSDYARKIYNYLSGKKQFPDWFSSLTGQYANAVLNGIKNCDGYINNANSFTWSTISKKDVDVIQRMCINNGYSFTYKHCDNSQGFGNGRIYKTTIFYGLTKNKKCKIKNIEYSGPVYCLSMPLGNFITRYNGKVAFSGNTAIIKKHETDLIDRLVDRLNAGQPEDGWFVQKGGYTGHIRLRFSLEGLKKGNGISQSLIIKYRHGHGGGGPVTQGHIQSQRDSVISDADIVVSGHVHERYIVTYMKEQLTSTGRIILKEQTHVRTPTYKDEYKQGEGGWHVETGKPPKPLGAWWLICKPKRISEKGERSVVCDFDLLKAK